jgi:transposase-like protein
LYYCVQDAQKRKSPIIDGNEARNAVDVIDELKRLRKENARLMEEREILKKPHYFSPRRNKSDEICLCSRLSEKLSYRNVA